MIPRQRLRQLRNDLRVDEVLRHLGVPTKHREGFLRFLCPLCREFNTATNPKTNLGRCFRCERNFNPIDLTMIVHRCRFIDAVAHLESFLD